MVIVVLGVTGAGKTSFGKALAEALGWPFADADDYHTPEAIAQLKRGEPLSDTYREQWLACLRTFIDQWLMQDESGVLACSALKARYRAQLAHEQVRFVYLRISQELSRRRVQERLAAGKHFVPPSLVESQFAILEEPSPEQAVWVDEDSGLPVASFIAQVRFALGLDSPLPAGRGE